MEFKVGDKVKWSSQAQGCTTEKTGVVEAVVPATVHPKRVVLRSGARVANMTRMFDGLSRNHESYLVSVVRGKTDKAAPVLYWPRVSALKPA